MKNYSIIVEDGEGFNLPLKWKPGVDFMNKMLSSDPKTVNLIACSLVGNLQYILNWLNNEGKTKSTCVPKI